MTKPLPNAYLATAPAQAAEGPLSRSGQRGKPSDKEGDLRAAVAAAYDAHHELVYRIALRYGGGRGAWAEDVTQEVFLQLVRHAGDLDDLDALGGWLYRTATRRCLNKLRK